jgi:hypothetical protein
VSWSDTQVVAAVAADSLTGIVRVQQNGVQSNAMGFTVALREGDTVDANVIRPNLLTMSVGDTRALQALTTAGQPAMGLMWTSSDATVVGLSTDDPPLLIAVAAGHATIKAGTASADVTVLAGALPVGTVLWSNPGNGSGVGWIVPAVPSPSGVADVFAFQADGTVQAITADGSTAWTAQAQGGIPDFQGGLIVVEGSDSGGNSIVKLDGTDGHRYPAYSSGSGTCSYLAAHTDGTIFAVFENQDPDYHASVVGIDPTTGTQKFIVPIPNTALGDMRFRTIQGLMIAGDGYAYVPYAYASDATGSIDYWPSHLMVLRVNSSGAWDDIKILDFDGGLGDDISVPTSIITNGDQGTLLSWDYSPGGEWKSGMAITTGTSVSLISAPEVPGQAGGQAGDHVVPVLQAQDGSFVGTASTGEEYVSMIAFDATGSVRWMVPGYWPMIATADGGVIAQAYDPATQDYTGPVVTFDQSGSVTGQLASLPIYSWKGAYRLGSTNAEVPDFDPAEMATTYAAVEGGNLTGNGFSLVHHTFGLVFCGPNRGDDGGCSSTPDVTFSYYPGIDDTNYANAKGFGDLYPEWVRAVKDQALESYKAAFAKIPAIVARGETASKLHHDQNPDNLNSFDHTVYIDGHWMLKSESPRSGLRGLDAAYPPNGYTNPGNNNLADAKHKWSWAYYLPIMGNAQTALGCLSAGQCTAAVSPALSPQSPFFPTDPTSPTYTASMAQFGQLMPAIGRGIGNVAAHETAHQFVPFNLMDCVNSCESKDVFEAAGSTGALNAWFYSENAFYQPQGPGTPIKAKLHWGNKVAAAIMDYLLPKK